MGIFFEVHKSGAPFVQIGQFTIEPAACTVTLTAQDGADIILERWSGFAVWSGDLVLRYFALQSDAESFATSLDVYVRKEAGRVTPVFHSFYPPSGGRYGLGVAQQDIEWRADGRIMLFRPTEYVVIQQGGFAIGGDESGPFSTEVNATRYLDDLLNRHGQTLSVEPELDVVSRSPKPKGVGGG
jgi:hypothetical protein